MDWIHTALPYIGGIVFEVWNGVNVRTAKWGDWTLIYTDCGHPLQNAFCDVDAVKAWRIEQIDTKSPD